MVPPVPVPAQHRGAEPTLRVLPIAAPRPHACSPLAFPHPACPPPHRGPRVPGRREAAAEPHRSHLAPPPPALTPGENPPPCLGCAALRSAPLRAHPRCTAGPPPLACCRPPRSHARGAGPGRAGTSRAQPSRSCTGRAGPSGSRPAAAGGCRRRERGKSGGGRGTPAGRRGPRSRGSGGAQRGGRSPQRGAGGTRDGSPGNPSIVSQWVLGRCRGGWQDGWGHLTGTAGLSSAGAAARDPPTGAGKGCGHPPSPGA